MVLVCQLAAVPSYLYKATPSDTLVSRTEVSLIACGQAAFVIMSYLHTLTHYNTV